MSEQKPHLERKLTSRLISMISLGGAIGTGLFLTSGETIATAGPMGALTAYILIGIMVYFLMMSLGEMASYMPTTGSFSTYATKFVDPAFGFASGWNYWFNWAITLAVDVSAVGLVMQYWFPHTPSWVFSAVALFIILLLNLFSVGVFGETEYWFAGIKIVAIIAFLIIGVLTIIGVFGNHVDVARNLSVGNHGFVGGIPAILSVFVVAGFSFQGTELIGITAGETKDPKKSIPKAINSVFWRILIFYIATIAVISAIVYYKDPRLLNASSDVAVSPFTLVFQNAGIAFAASVMNAVILTSILSSANSGTYASSRMLYSMSKTKDAPKIFGKTSKAGVPIIALLATAVVGLLAFLGNSGSGGQIFTWLVAASGLTGFIAWIGIAISHYRFRCAFLAQGHKLSELPYVAKWFPAAPIIALIMSILVIIGQDFQSFMEPIKDWNWEKIGLTYISIPLFLILYLGYKIINKTKLVPLKEVDLKND